MKKNILLWGITLLILLTGILGSWYVLRIERPRKIAEIYQNDQLIERIDLSQVTESYTIAMQSASCPDRLCVHQGKISDGILPIICLPNHIRIAIVSEEEASYDVQVY